MKKLTKKQDKEINKLCEMLEAGWHYTDHPMHHKFMQAHNVLPDYKNK
tara:strand:- start:1720 stop:1863 length:144 start_codon:yes stop_codon:yes gene_type:complete